MADEKISLELFIEADKANLSLGELEQGFDAMKEQLKDVGRGSKEFKELSTAMAQTTAEIKNIELGFEGLDKEQVASELGGLAGGIGDVTASLVLMGGENETMQQMAASIEKAMAISMGMKGAIEGMAAANKLYTNVLKKSTAMQKLLTLATKGWGKALIATGIGAIIAAIVLLITYWDDLTVALGISTKAQRLNTQVTHEAVDAVADEISASDKLQKTLKDESLTREEKNRAIIALQEEYPNLLSNIDAEKDSLDDINEALVLNTQLIVLRAKQEAIASLRVEEVKKQYKEIADAQTGANVGLIESWLGWQTASLGAGDAQDLANASSIKSIKASRKQVTALDDLDAALQKEIDSLLEVGAVGETEIKQEEKREKKRDQWKKKKIEDNKQLIEDAKVLAEFEEEQSRIKIQLIQDEGERARAEIEYNTQLELEALEQKGQLTFEAEMLIAQKKNKALADLEKEEDTKRFALEKEAQAKRDEYDKLLFDAKVTNETEETEKQKLQLEEDFQNNLATLEEQGILTMELEFELTYAKEQALAAIEDEARKTKATKDKEQRDKDFALATAAIGALSALNDAALATDLLNAAGDEEKKEKIRKASFERQKKLNIAMALINGAQAVLAGFAQGGLPMAIIAGVTAAAQLAAIVATTYQGGGGAAVTTPDNTALSPDGAGDGSNGVQLSPVSNTSTILGNQQVFVTETDITNTQNNVSVIEESATF
jgi:hypothetical protein